MKILVVYYSMYGHVLQLARAVEQGAKSVPGVEIMKLCSLVLAGFLIVISGVGPNRAEQMITMTQP